MQVSFNDGRAIVKDRNGRSYRRRAGEYENKYKSDRRTFYGCFFAQNLCVIIVLVSNQKMTSVNFNSPLTKEELMWLVHISVC